VPAPATGGVIVTGDISVGSGADVSLVGGSGFGASAQIGHGGRGVLQQATLGGGATVAGNIDVTAVGSIDIAAGTGAGNQAFAQIGHGGAQFGYALHGTSVSIGGGI